MADRLQTPPPTTPVRSWPTPVIGDFLLVTEHNTELPSYKPLDYGTPYENQRDFPNHKLVFQKPSRTEKWVQRFWAVDEVSPDIFNYATSYVDEGKNFPVYIRTYRVLRNAPRLDDLSADPIHATALLVKEDREKYEPESPYYSLYEKAIRVYETLPGPILSEQEYDQVIDVAVPRTRQKVKAPDAGIGTNRRDIKALSSNVSEVTTFDPAAVAAALGRFLLSFPTTTTLEIPDVLNSITIATESSVGTGTATENIDLYDWHGDHSLTTPLKATAQGSALMSADVIPKLTPFYGVRREVTNYMFFLEAPVTSADVTAKLATITGLTVTNWAVFKPSYTTIVLISKKQSVQVSAGITIHDSNNSGGNALVRSSTAATSNEVGITVKTVRVPATIHGNITLVDQNGIPIGSGPTPVTAMVTATVTGPAGFAVLAPSLPSVSANATGSLKIITDGLTATSGATSLPSSGLLIVSTNGRPYRFGWVQINAEVIDASTL